MGSPSVRSAGPKAGALGRIVLAMAATAGIAGVGVLTLSPALAQQPMQAEIVVKFKDDAKVKEIVDLFWRDQAAARTRFARFCESRDEFDGLKLARVTYSNELVLVADGAPPAPAAFRALARALAAHPDISYADANMTAHPGAH